MGRLDWYCYAATTVIPSEKQQWTTAVPAILDDQMGIVQDLLDTFRRKAMTGELFLILIIKEEAQYSGAVDTPSGHSLHFHYRV